MPTPSPRPDHASLTADLGGRLAWGADYNPEQWPPETVEEDVRLMQEAGVTMATIGVFSWAWLEPEPGTFTFDWLDRVLDRLTGGGIAIDLATATASPPAWLHEAHPEILPVTADGTVLGFGSRQAWCPSSPIVREHQLRLVEQLAARYGQHDGLALWHVGNEYGCHVSQCHCPTSRQAFRAWLADRYGDVETLNAAWGTAFWSQRYTSFDQVGTPAATPAQPNPTQQLDFRRFSSDALRACYRAERDLLRHHTPDVPITTNFMALWTFDGVEYADWMDEVDLVTNDHYLRGTDERPERELAFSADRVRGLAGGDPWLLMEHSTSAVNWQPANLAKGPGELARNSLAHVARGSNGAMFFQWRQSLAGAERFHSAMLPHAGTDTRVWREVVEMGRHLRALAPVADTVTAPARVVVLSDTTSEWALGRPSLPVVGISHGEVARSIHAAFWDHNVACDVVPPATDLDGWDVVVVPAVMLVDDGMADRLDTAARQGAHVVVTFASGLADLDDHVFPGGYPGAFRDLLGLSTEEFTPPRRGATVQLDNGWAGRTWFEDVAVQDAEVVARAIDGPRPGGPAVTRAVRGDGAAWYVATWLDEAGWAGLVGQVLAASGVEPVADVDAGIEAVRRIGPDGSWLFLLNHHDEPRTARGISGHEVLADRAATGVVEVPAGGVAVVHEDGREA